MRKDEQSSDSFQIGYHMRGLEDAVRRLEQQHRKLEQKIDALGADMTPAERAAVIAKINADAAAVTRVASELHDVARTMDATAPQP